MNRPSPSSIKAIFTEYYNGLPNLLTPDAYKWGLRSKDDSFFIWELSKGEGMLRDSVIYGVTVLEIDFQTHKIIKSRNDLSAGGFRTELQAKAHLARVLAD